MLIFYPVEIYESVLQQCLQQGITNFVLCPGARNAPLVLSLQRTEGLELYYHPDERSASFFALGRTMSFDEPCAVITTSGTAVAECLPAVIEAHYQARPLVIISADRPESYRGTGAPQSIDQVGLFSHYAHYGRDFLPGESPFTDWSGRTPLHINVPLQEQFDQEQILPLPLKEIGEFKPLKESFDGSLIVDFIKSRSFTGLVLMIGGLRPHEREAVYHLADTLQVPVIADPHSGLREALADFLVLQPEQTLAQEPPGKVLRLGEVPHGRYWRDLENDSSIEVLSVCNSGYAGLSRESQVIKGDVGRIISGIGEQSPIGDVLDHLENEQSSRNTVDELLEAFPSSEPGLLRALSIHVTMGESLYLGNSLPIREWSSFAQRDVPLADIWANRGANGIDGQIATWLGTTREVENAWCIIGDLTALYDLNALAMQDQIDLSGRRLVIINNGGGQIFTHLPRLQSISNSEQERFTQQHNTSFQHYAQMWGWDYLRATTPEDLDEQSDYEGALLIEITPDPAETEQFWQALRR